MGFHLRKIYSIVETAEPGPRKCKAANPGQSPLPPPNNAKAIQSHKCFTEQLTPGEPAKMKKEEIPLKHRWSKAFSILLALVLVLSLLPVRPLAAERGTLRIGYDPSNGSVFLALADDEPQGLAEEYAEPFTDMEFSQGQAVTLLLDDSRGLDWEAWENGEIRFTDSIEHEDRSISVQVSYDTGKDFVSEFVVVQDQTVVEGFDYDPQTRLLRFTMPSYSWVEIVIQWTDTDYYYEAFQGTEDKPILVDAYWAGEGRPEPQGVPAEDVLEQDGRLRLRLPLESASVTFTWESRFPLEGLQTTDREGDWVAQPLPAENSFALPLDQFWDNGEKKTFYSIEFSFSEYGIDLFRVDYDVNGGLVFQSVGSEDPEPAEEDFLMAAWNGDGSFPAECSYYTDSGPGTIRLLLDETRALDWDALWEGRLEFVRPWHADDRAIFICLETYDPEVGPYQALVVENGQVTEAFRDRATFENHIFTYQPDHYEALAFRLYWTESDYRFSEFYATEDRPVLVELNWWGSDVLQLPPEIPAEDCMVANGRARLRVGPDVTELTFTWPEDVNPPAIYVEGLGDLEAEGNGYTLLLNQTEDGHPKNWYYLTFQFEEELFDRSGLFYLSYDQNYGAVFYALGDETPVAEASAYVDAEDRGFCYSFAPDGTPQTVRLLLDETKSLDWDTYFNQNRVAFTEAWELPRPRSLYVWLDTNAYSGPLVEAGRPVEGVSLENNVLSFTPPDTGELHLRVYWTEEDYAFDLFRGTEQAPVVIDVNCWDGMILVPDTVPEQDVITLDNRLRFRVGFDTESVTFTWPEGTHVHTVGVESLYTLGEWAEVELPEDAVSYTLRLDQVWEDGSPKDWYSLNFQFRQDLTGMLLVDWERAEGNVYAAVNADPQAGNLDQYPEGPVPFCVPDENGAILPGEIRLLLDPTHSVSYFDSPGGEIDLPAYDYLPSIWVEFTDGEGNRIEDFAVKDGHAVLEGFTFEDNLLTFRPESPEFVSVVVIWSEAELEFRGFQGTEDKPVQVQLLFAMGRQVQIPAGVPEEDVITWKGAQHTRVKVRLPLGQKSLSLQWDREGRVDLIRLHNWNHEDGWNTIEAPEGLTFTLALNQTYPDGSPALWYELEIWSSPIVTLQLARALEEAESVDRSLYSEQSLAALDEQIARVYQLAEVMQSDQWPEDLTQESVDALTQTLLQAVAALQPKTAFADLLEGAYYVEPVNWAVANGITNGTSETTFSPDRICTRGQVVTFLWRAKGSPTPQRTDNPFTDVAEGAYYYHAILWAVEQGITNGTSPTTFGPDNPCTRGQVVTFLWRAEDEPEPASAENPFADVEPNRFFYKPVLWAVEHQVTNGKSATSFAPNDTCTRGQIVTFLYRDMNAEPGG